MKGASGFFIYCAMVFGIAAGMLNGWLIWNFKLAIFDFSLGMSSVIFGLLALSAGSRTTSGPLQALVGWNKKWLMTVQSVSGESGLHVSVLIDSCCNYRFIYISAISAQRADIFTLWEATNQLLSGPA